MPNPLLALAWTGLATVLALLVFRPGDGLFWRWQHTRQLTDRVLSEDALKHPGFARWHAGRVQRWWMDAADRGKSDAIQPDPQSL